jgi:dTDP-4-amino-4,6-dideoxygalactose transaminase
MDLKRQYEAHKEGILGAIRSVCEETAFSGGKYAERFEKKFAEYCGCKFASGLKL